MTTYEYRTWEWDWRHSGGQSLNDLGHEGWEVYQVHVSSVDQKLYFLRRRTDRYCEHCAKAAATMDKLERLTG